MAERRMPEPTTDEDKPRYEPPQMIDLRGIARAQGGITPVACRNGSTNRACLTGFAAGSTCLTGNGVLPPPCANGGDPFAE